MQGKTAHHRLIVPIGRSQPKFQYSLMQNCFPLADMRQGTTSVVPQMTHFDSVFSRCVTANN
jgi:hypothetical protein